MWSSGNLSIPDALYINILEKEILEWEGVMKKRSKFAIVVILLAIAAIYYYVSIPAVNIHSAQTWFFVMTLFVVLIIYYAVRKRVTRVELGTNKILRSMIGLLVVFGIVYLAGSVLSSPIINAKKYQKLMKVETGEFSKDVKELSYDRIPLLDKDTAARLGDRKMGSMVDMVSQFEADDIYSQINYKNNPVRVTPLKYANLIKWFTNRREGIPAYPTIIVRNMDKICSASKMLSPILFSLFIYLFIFSSLQ